MLRALAATSRQPIPVGGRPTAACAASRVGHSLPRLDSRLREILGSSLVRNGYSLTANVGITSILGMIYWLLAARLYSVETVGVNAALISTMTALSGFSQLTLPSVLTRFLPTAGRHAGRWILVAYGSSIISSVIFSLAFLIIASLWLPKLRFVTEDATLALGFMGATICWTIFALQDGALTGLRQSIWVPIENAAYAFAKICLLVAFAAAGFLTLGVFTSWVAPLLLLILPVNWLIFRVVLVRGGRAGNGAANRESMEMVGRFLGGDFIGTLSFYAASGIAPVLVLESAGPAANAQYYLAWTITYSLYLVAKSMGASLTAEGAAHRGELSALAARTLAHTMTLLVLAVATVLVAAPYILSLFGPDYARDGATLLRVLSLSAIPFGYTAVHLGVARVRGNMIDVAGIQGAMMVLVLGLGILLLGRVGPVGISLAWLIAQTVLAVALLLRNRSRD